jgi:acyl-CoA synthetase (AMP-forming)/AMP-acid ligase II
VKLGGESFQTRVVDGILQIKAKSAMLGYLNAPSPFTADGWFDTNDTVEVDGDYLKILGRASEIINVGGEKVYPAEVESVIQELETVADAIVFGEKNPITGNIVCAQVLPAFELEDARRKEFIAEVKRHCRQNLQSYKVPVKVSVVNEQQHSERFKKIRR